MPILNYTTSIDAEKTIGEIQKILVKHGANKIVTDFVGGIPESVTFCLRQIGLFRKTEEEAWKACYELLAPKEPNP